MHSTSLPQTSQPSGDVYKRQVIRDAVGFRVRVAVCVRPCVGLRAVSGFDDDLFGEDVLLFKQHLERTLHLIQRELALMELSLIHI